MKTQSGLTLVELMTTLAVGIIILAIGVPAFMTMMSSNQAAGYANDLVGAIRLARSEAIKRSDMVTICASNAAQTACSGNNWINGWIVFSDDSNYATIDEGETIHRVWAISEDDKGSYVFKDTPPNAIRFDAAGGNTAGAETQFAFQPASCTGRRARQITVAITGRPSLAYVACKE
jgi:type IV fimbrial biogenesis protein FimT